jgi:hypothetical protein
MSSAKKILTKLSAIESKLDEVLSRLTKLETSGGVNSKTIGTTPADVKVGKVLITEYDNYILITGDTFDIRNDFKVYRGKWDGDSKGWKIMSSNLSDYENFKDELKKKSTTLQVSKGKISKSSNVVNTDSGGGGASGACMISDSSDSDSE